MTEGGDIVTTLRDSEAKGIAITIHIYPVQNLVMPRRVALAPQPIPRARVVHTTPTFQGSNNRFLVSSSPTHPQTHQNPYPNPNKTQWFAVGSRQKVVQKWEGVNDRYK